MGTVALVPAVLVVSALGTWVGVRMAGFEPQAAAVHWTELARRSWPARRGVDAATKLVPTLLFGVLAWQRQPLELAAVVALAAFAGISWIGVRMGRQLRPEYRWGDYFAGVKLRLIHAWSWLAVVAAVAPWCSDDFDARTIGVLLLGAAGLVWFFLRGFLLVDRWAGLHEAAPPALVQLVSAVAADLGTRPPNVRILALNEIQAYAYPGTDTIAISKGALAHLTEEQVRAVLAHEVGHLTERGRGRLIAVLVSSVFLIGMAAYHPIVHALNVASYAAIVLALWYWGGILAGYSGYDPQRSELHADEAARQHVSGASYAGALEHIYRWHLIPAVLDHEDSPGHPNLYDRMTMAGIVPDYPRPEVPSINRRTLVVVPPLLATLLTMWVILSSTWY